MNSINFQEGGFPLHVDTLRFMQNTYGAALRFMAAVGGDNYILYGCQQSGSVIADGALVIGGEILPFKRGTLQRSVVVRESKRALNYEDGDSKDSYITRWVEFGTGINQIPWSSLNPIENLQELKAKIDSHQHTIPPGLISMWSGSTPPTGWALCNGENGTPNLQDRFIVGASDSQRVGTTGGAKEVTLTAEQMPKHSHNASAESAGDHNHTMLRSGNHGHPFKNYFFSENIIAGDLRAGSSYGYEYIARGIGAAGADYDNNRVYYKRMNTSREGNHQHAINRGGEHLHNVEVGDTGGSKAHENRPPFYALAFIIKL